MTVWSLLLMAAPLAQVPLAVEIREPQAVPMMAPAGIGWTEYQATVSAYLGEAVPPHAPIPVSAPPAVIGLSEPTASATAMSQLTACCDPSAQGYVDGLCANCQCQGKCQCGKHKHRCLWFGGDDDDCSGCLKYSTCDLYPHYAYYPKHHGYYYFRPYNYTMVPVQQQTAVKLGGDARNPYSTELLANLTPATQQPVPSTTRTMRQGPTLPMLEQLIEPKPAAY